MNYRSFEIVAGETATEDGWFYKIYGYGHKKTPAKFRLRRAMMGYASEQDAIQKAKNVIDLKIREGKWQEGQPQV
jgi:hypothetical protein